MKIGFFKQTSFITSFFAIIFFMVNWIAYSNEGMGMSVWIMLENTWTLPIFGLVLLVIIPFERKSLHYFQAILFFAYGFLMILGKGINYDCIPLFFIGTLLLRKYSFFRNHAFGKVMIVMISIGILCYMGHFLSGLHLKNGWEDVHRCLSLIVSTSIMSCLIFRDDISEYQDAMSRQKKRRLLEAGEAIMSIRRKLYSLLSHHSDKNEEINTSIEILERVKTYVTENDKEELIQTNIIDYVEFALIFAQPGVEIIRKYDPEIRVEILKHDFVKAMVSLVIRARESMKKRKTKILEITAQKGSEGIILIFKDNGIGLTRTEKMSLWESDRMIDVKNCVAKHGWEIVCETVEGMYTQLVITIPVTLQ